MADVTRRGFLGLLGGATALAAVPGAAVGARPTITDLPAVWLDPARQTIHLTDNRDNVNITTVQLFQTLAEMWSHPAEGVQIVSDETFKTLHDTRVPVA